MHQMVHRCRSGWAANGGGGIVVRTPRSHGVVVPIVEGGMDHGGLGRMGGGMQHPDASHAAQHKQAGQNKSTQGKVALHNLHIPLGGIYGKKNGTRYGGTPHATAFLPGRA